ncbi:MAG: response regulator transcription factor [Porticoccaceae bacterium]
MRILLIEDNSDIALGISDYFEQKKHIVDAVGDGVSGLHFAITRDYDVIVLDLALPGIDGLTLCDRLRKQASNWTPVLMLTARDTLDDRLRGFDAGTDDYLIKPFSLRELEMRIQALTRRSQGGTSELLRVADLEMDLANYRVHRAGTSIALTRTEFQILEKLMRNPGRVVRRAQLEEATWGDNPPDGDALRVHIHHLRAAIDRDFTPPLLNTVRGVGYRLGGGDALSP